MSVDLKRILEAQFDILIKSLKNLPGLDAEDRSEVIKRVIQKRSLNTNAAVKRALHEELIKYAQEKRELTVVTPSNTDDKEQDPINTDDPSGKAQLKTPSVEVQFFSPLEYSPPEDKSLNPKLNFNLIGNLNMTN